MTKKKRVIPILNLRQGQLVQSFGFKEYRNLGNPKHSVLRFSQWDVDEIVYMDIGDTEVGNIEQRLDLNKPIYGNMYELLDDISSVARMPVTVGGGIRTAIDIEKRLASGADKVSLNRAFRENKNLASLFSKEFGSQCIVASIDYVTENDGKAYVYEHETKRVSNQLATEWAATLQDLGVGEILINDVKRDGMKTGYGIETVYEVCEKVQIPVIAAGGASDWGDMAKLLELTSVDGVAASNIFFFQDQSVYLARKYLWDKGFPVRPPSLSSVQI